jgi:ATP-dependent Lhr-like helicase
MLVPANRFEVLECLAALEAVEARELDGDPPRPGLLDVLAQHIVGRLRPAVRPDAFFAEVRRHPALSRPAAPGLRRHVLDFVATGGYALRPTSAGTA